MRVSGLGSSSMGMECRNGQMEPPMKGNGWRGKPMVKGSLCMLMVTFMKENGKMIKRVDTELTLIVMEPHTKDIGRTTYSTEMELRCGLTGANMKASTDKAKSMGSACTNGQMAAHTKATGPPIGSKGRASTPGQTEESTMENGGTIKCMDKARTDGEMEGAMMEIMSMIKNTVSEPILGQMDANISDIGKMGEDMAKESMF